MLKLSNDLNTALLKFNQKTLNKGELFLFAKAIADSLPLYTIEPNEDSSIGLYIASNKRTIDSILYSMSEYRFISAGDRTAICNLISQLSFWRHQIAFNPPPLIFRDECNVVIDDISILPRYVDVGYMCAVGDIVKDATYLYDLFKKLVTEVLSGIKTNVVSNVDAVK